MYRLVMKDDIFSKKGSAAALGKKSSVEQHDQFISNLRHAICNDELRLRYQPRYDMITARAGVLEALVRWRRPGVGLFYPEIFIASAEDNGLIFSLDLWVFERCCIDLKQLQNTINPNLKIAVNVSALSCESIYYAQKVIETSEKHGVLLSDFEFEISATTHIRDIRKVLSFCETLKNYGVVFSVDNLGAGQSSLSDLSVLPITTVNIDQSFVHGVGNSKRCEIIICSLTNMVKELGMQAVAKGVEKNEQYWFMREAGCNQQQGFLLGRPMDIEKIELPVLTEPTIDNW